MTNAFIGQTTQPTEQELTRELASAKTLWDRLLNELALEHRLTEYVWSSYSPKAGWTLRLQAKKRNIVYLSPQKGKFMTSFALGDKAMALARRTKLPAKIQRLLTEARRYTEGTAVRIEVTKAADLDIVKKLVAIKIAN